MTNTTESASNHENLDKKSVSELLYGINEEDHKVAPAVKASIPQIERLVEAVLQRMREGGRLFYIGAGTSGRLAIVDASECPPTFGVPHELVVGIMAGGDMAIRKAVEFAEDDQLQAWEDLQKYKINKNDSLIGIAASGRTPYVIGGVDEARKNGVLTGCITCNRDSQLTRHVQYPVEVIVGPEFVTGSTRMKAGTAQKLVLNMITTTLMIRLGHVRGNKMVDMQLSNKKLIERGTKMVMSETSLDQEKAKRLLLRFGSVRAAVSAYRSGKT